MKFRKFGKALLMSAISAGAIFSLSSCVQSYTVGFLYVTGTQTSGNAGHGIISGFKIDHNTGKLSSVNGLPISSGGANPVRADMPTGDRFLYVLNQGVDAANGSNCTSATAPCKGSNVVQFSVGGNGILVQQETFTTALNNPMRMFSDPQGAHLFVLNHDAPDSGNGAGTNSCSLALGATVHTCGAVTVFSIDANTGRLSIVQNAQVTSASGQHLSYFPVPADPIDMAMSQSYLLTLAGTPASGDVVFPYGYDANNGQLSISQNGEQPLNIMHATAIQSNSQGLFVLDNEPLTANGTQYPAQILPFTVGAGGALLAQGIGAIPDPPGESNPLFLLLEKRSLWVYVANSGDNANQNNPQSGIAGYQVDPTKSFKPIGGSPWSTGAGPQCLVEDPSNQFIYTANFNDSTVTGHSITQTIGILTALPGTANKAYLLPGPATYCVMNGRTS